MIQIFAFLEKDEYLLFKDLYDIYYDYTKYNKNEDNITLECLMNFYNHYFDHKKEELSTLLFDCQKFILNRSTINNTNEVLEFNFLDFVYSIIFLLYNININKDINMTEELFNIYSTHTEFLSENYYKRLFKDDGVSNLLRNYLDLLKKVFENYGNKKFNGYVEMSLDQFKNLIKNALKKKKKDGEIEKLLTNIVFFHNIDFIDFLMFVINVADIIDENPDTEITTKIENFVNNFYAIENPILNEKLIK